MPAKLLENFAEPEESYSPLAAVGGRVPERERPTKLGGGTTPRAGITTPTQGETVGEVKGRGGSAAVCGGSRPGGIQRELIGATLVRCELQAISTARLGQYNEGLRRQTTARSFQVEQPLSFRTRQHHPEAIDATSDDAPLENLAGCQWDLVGMDVIPASQLALDGIAGPKPASGDLPDAFWGHRRREPRAEPPGSED
jgi:hypothetical protein